MRCEQVRAPNARMAESERSGDRQILYRPLSYDSSAGGTGFERSAFYEVRAGASTECADGLRVEG